MHLRSSLVLALASSLAVLLASACGSSGGSGDPLCVALCTIKEPSTAGAGDICSQASADACLDQCGARIEGTTAACGACLLDDADFDTGDETSGGGCEPTLTCPEGECTDTGSGGSCKFCSSDEAAQKACYVQAHPRREVACKTDFRDPLECSALCAAK